VNQSSIFSSQFVRRLRTIRNSLLALCITFVFVGTPALSASRHKVEVISGRVIAYSGTPLCLNGNSYWEIVIRVEPQKEAPSRLVQVDFSLPCEQSPKSVLVDSSIHRSHLIRQKELDSVLEESINLLEQDSGKGQPALNSRIFRWTYLPGAESFKLPFGETLPCYHSLEFPHVPVL